MYRLQEVPGSFLEIQARAIADFNLHLSNRRGYGVAWKPMTLASRRSRLDKVVVNFIRHKLTSYDKTIANMLKRCVEQTKIQRFQAEVFASIARIYPDLAQECKNQARFRGIDWKQSPASDAADEEDPGLCAYL